MMYALNDLLQKMGAPEVRERGHIEWHYFDKTKNALEGFAEIRLEAGGERLVAEMKSIRENYIDDLGETHPVYTESFYLYAERTARAGYYRINKLSLDGDDYNSPQKGVVELGLSVFHARALDISIRMVEQVFNKQDILEPIIDPTPKFRAMFSQQKEIRRESFGVVIPFRPRGEVRVRA
ncbi:MAG: hypothetical protein PW788_10025 [Micavibrio sp.]|nr:hypothetical protein [Micavibrio sp.]